VRECRHKVSVSYDDDDEGFIRSLYPKTDGFHIAEKTWAYCGTTDKKKKSGKELLILNYAPAGVQRMISFPEPTGEALTAAEEATLLAHEQMIEGAVKAWCAAGQSLKSIRDENLYRKYPTFDAYCKVRWEMTPRHAQRLMIASDVCAVVRPIGRTLPATESQARELSKLRNPDGSLDTELIADVWVTVASAAGEEKITAKLIREHVVEHLPARCENQKQDTVARLLSQASKLNPEEFRRFEERLRELKESILREVAA
jgi:hypothetical protein